MSDEISKGRFSVPGRLELQLVTVSAGIPKLFPHDTKLHVDGKAEPGPKIAKALDDEAATLKALREAHIALAAAALAAREARRKGRKLLTAVRDNAVLMLGADKVADLGFAARRPPRKLTADELKKRALLAAATRRARGTLGKAERARIKGTLDPGKDGPETSA